MSSFREYLREKISQSSFCILVWKNYLLKRKSPWVTVFELATPLVLFFLLYGLRGKQPVQKYAQTYFNPQPLPSAGMLAVLQEFCPDVDGTDVYGYPIYNRSAIGPFLEDLHHAWANSSQLHNISLNQDIINFDAAVTNLSKTSDKFNEQFQNTKTPKIHVFQILKNSSEFYEYLNKNLSLPSDQANNILNSTINISKLLEYSTTISKYQDFSTQNHKIIKRSVNFPYSLFHFHSLTKIPKLMKTILKSSNSVKHKQSGIIDNQSNNVIQPLLLMALYGDDGLLDSYANDTNQQFGTLLALESILFTPQSLRFLICDQNSKILSIQQNTTSVSNNFLCTNSSVAKLNSLSSELFRQVNNTALLDYISEFSNSSSQVTKFNKLENNLESVMISINDLNKLSKYLNSLSTLAKFIPKNSCVELDLKDVNNTDSLTTTQSPNLNSTTQLNKTTTNHKKSKNLDLLEIWLAVQPLLCGKNINDDHKTKKGTKKSEDFFLTGHQKHNLGILIHVLTSNPKILYAPNNTQVDEVILKANTSFAIIDLITKAAVEWKNVSKTIRNSLSDPSVNKTINWLYQLRKAYREDPSLVGNLTTNQPLLTNFLQSNTSLPNTTTLHNQLNEIDNAACAWRSLVVKVSINWFKGFKNETEAVKYATTRAYHDNASVFATVIFEVDKNGNLPPHVVYKIRQNASFTQDTNQIRLPYYRPDPKNWDFRYYNFGFVWLQDLIERAIIWQFVGHDVVSPGAYLHEIPFPCYRLDQFAMNLEHIMPLAMIISWVYTVAMLVQHIVYEKERRLKEVMKIMGLSNGVHWMAWFTSMFLQLEVTVTVIAFLLKFGNVLGNSSFIIIWLFFSLYAACTIMFCFLVSVLFSKAKVASACSGIIYFMTYLPFAYMSIQEFVLHQSVSRVAKLFASLLSTTAFGLGAKYFALYELSGVGIQWSNISLTPVEGDTFSLAQVAYMLMVDTVLYGVLTWYIEAVFPGQYGLPRPWYFPFTQSYWMGHGGTESECFSARKLYERLRNSRNYQSVTEHDQAVAMETNPTRFIEQEPDNLKLGLSVQNLTKIYKRGKKKAVDKLYLNLYENQITSFLGHNGAGKTTTMSILTGLIPPTSGSAYVYGCDIRTDMLDIRKSLGMCPQHNVLFDVLTVEEHLWFYARLKGVAASDIDKEMDQFLFDIGLQDKRNSKIETLSGGMKRKLSVAIAFVGGSRTIILDEPTAGVDPYARRAIWDLIVKYKVGRTILLSTHHMDEADLLGDRIAIISNGKLQCCGSSLFLKSTYGNGYTLTLVKKDFIESTSSCSSSQQVSVEDKITRFVQTYVPMAILTHQTPTQLTFILPSDSCKKGCFSKLFHKLPSHLDTLGIKSYGLNDTTLEQVFLKVDENTRWESELSTNSSSPKLKNSPSKKPHNPLPNHHDNKPNDLRSEVESTDDLSSEVVPRKQSYLTSVEQEANDMALAWLNSPINYDVQKTPNSSENLLKTEQNFLCGSTNNISSQRRNPFDNNSITSLEQDENSVFNDDVPLLPNQDSNSNNDSDDDELLNLSKDNDGMGSYKLSPLCHNLRILKGLLLKRLHYARRSRKAVFYQIMLPSVFVSIAMTVALSLPKAGDPPPLTLSPSMFHNITQPRGNFIPYTDQRALFSAHYDAEVGSGLKFVDADPTKLISTFTLPSGVGATCVLKSPFNSTFDLFDLNLTTSDGEFGDLKLLSKYFNPECQWSFTGGLPLSQFLPPVTPDIDFMNVTDHTDWAFKNHAPCMCTKDRHSYVCRSDYNIEPVIRKAVTGDWLLDITGKEPILPYLMYTTNKYRLHRYGGLSFGEVRTGINQSFPGWPSPLRKVAVRDAVQVLYNHKGFHSMPIYLNVLNNAIMRANLPQSKGNPAAYGITVINHPMNKTAGALTMDFLLSGTDVIIAIFIIVAMSFVPASFLVFLVAEKSSRAKHLQFISGASPLTYWIANYIWDMLNYMFPAAVFILILQIFDLPAYTRGPNAYAVVALFLLYGWSMTPMMYPASFYFDVPSTAYVCLIVLNLFVGITTVVTSFMISLFRDDPHLVAINKILDEIFLVFPNYNLGKGLMDLSYIEFMNEYYEQIGETGMIKSPFEWDLITRQLVAMAIEGIVGFLITVLFEVNFFAKKSKTKKELEYLNARGFEDADVAQERHRVTENNNEDLITVKNASKIYRKKQRKVVAVDQLNFGVGKGECFGLLGVNGAGKTTTFQMITGATEPSCGEVYVGGHKMSGRAQERLLAQQSTGYCPQFDALFNELTPLEHLLLYARLRGIPGKDEQRVSRWAIKKLDLEKYKNVPSGDLSGGNKRKLSVAIALIGYPSVVLLDEPTTGMDPVARRFLWDLILDVVKSGRSVLLTSHSMEECEVLCDRIAIMVNGRFQCLGETQHLKNKFGEGYMVSIRSQKPDRVASTFSTNFPSSTLKEQHYHRVSFQIPAQLLHQVFNFIEDKQIELSIDDFSVSQTTLDDVFINFAKDQKDSTIQETKKKLTWSQSCRNMFNKIFPPTSSPTPSPGDSPRSLTLTESSLLDNNDIEDDDEPLYLFDQNMSLSFIDSTC